MDTCDNCGTLAELFHNETTGLAFCEACDLIQDARDEAAIQDERDRGAEIREARAAEVAARTKAERLEREAALALREWTRTKLVRERAELWNRAEQLRTELARVEARASAIRMDSDS